jgi:arylformamidase
VILDISPRVSDRIGVWPGDVPYGRTITCAQSDGANLDLSSIRTTVHLGAHTDAPSHYVPDGSGIADRSLVPYLGPCEVIAVDVGRGERLLPSHLKGPIHAPRVLFHTRTFPDPERFTTDFAALSPALVHHLAEQGCVLVGLDTPSVDLFDDKELLSHHAIAEHDLSVLEGIVLSDVPEGLYTLIALPLPLEGADASPVRAVLVTLDDPTLHRG